MSSTRKSTDAKRAYCDENAGDDEVVVRARDGCAARSRMHPGFREVRDAASY